MARRSKIITLYSLLPARRAAMAMVFKNQPDWVNTFPRTMRINPTLAIAIGLRRNITKFSDWGYPGHVYAVNDTSLKPQEPPVWLTSKEYASINQRRPDGTVLGWYPDRINAFAGLPVDR